MKSDDLSMLLGARKGPCLSLFLPTHRQYVDKQDEIRFRNLLGRADELLRERYPSCDPGEFLEPLQAVSTTDFWKHQADGLAVFRAPDLMLHRRLPTSVAESVTVADSFHVKPLIGVLQSGQRFLLLCLSQNSVRFFVGDVNGLVQRDVADLPGSLRDALGVEMNERFVNVHSSTERGGAIYHGHGGPNESRKDDATRFLRVVDEALWPAVRDETAPLLLAGVAYYHPIYRGITRYRHVADEGIEGNFDHENPVELHRRVWPVAAGIFARREEMALEELSTMRGAGRAVDDLAAIARATVEGRVQTLFLSSEASVRGSFDRDSGTVRLARDGGEAPSEDLLDDIAEDVLRRGGDVLLLAPERLPAASPASAILRW